MPTSACTRHRKSHNGHRGRTKLSGWEVDKAARDVLQVAGYAEYLNNRGAFDWQVHGTGTISTT
jgi:Xaa-Pro aminopeptidase